mmetsp:Transcript_38640/g.116018  ORF Transcript_38640/g.116018 Transcript_38640/m.116018 type:complete len:306 (-) Transcript_38640:2008-2925(-)
MVVRVFGYFCRRLIDQETVQDLRICVFAGRDRLHVTSEPPVGNRSGRMKLGETFVKEHAMDIARLRPSLDERLEELRRNERSNERSAVLRHGRKEALGIEPLVPAYQEIHVRHDEVPFVPPQDRAEEAQEAVPHAPIVEGLAREMTSGIKVVHHGGARVERNVKGGIQLGVQRLLTWRDARILTESFYFVHELRARLGRYNAPALLQHLVPVAAAVDLAGVKIDDCALFRHVLPHCRCQPVLAAVVVYASEDRAGEVQAGHEGLSQPRDIWRAQLERENERFQQLADVQNKGRVRGHDDDLSFES